MYICGPVTLTEGSEITCFSCVKKAYMSVCLLTGVGLQTHVRRHTELMEAVGNRHYAT